MTVSSFVGVLSSIADSHAINPTASERVHRQGWAIVRSGDRQRRAQSWPNSEQETDRAAVRVEPSLWHRPPAGGLSRLSPPARCCCLYDSRACSPVSNAPRLGGAEVAGSVVVE